MRVGIFGGAFDPVHVGHLVLAERVRDDAGLDLVRFVPSYKPPHKDDRRLTRFFLQGYVGAEFVFQATVTGVPLKAGS